MSRSPSVLVLGGTGIIGRHLSVAAAAAGMAVCSVSRRPLAPTPVVDGYFCEHLVADVGDAAGLRRALDGRSFDVVVDLLTFDVRQLKSTFEALAGTFGQYMLVSSATVYEGVEPPQRLTEVAQRVAGPWSYPLEKLRCERWLMDSCRSGGDTYTIVRPYITYSEQRLSFGVWEARDVMARIAGGQPVVIGDELTNQPTSVTHSKDLARGMVALMGNQRAANVDVHIASDATVTWGRIFELAAAAAGAELDVVAAPVHRILDVFPELHGKLSDRMLGRSFDNGRLRSLCPGFAFEYSPEAGYAETIDRMVRSGLPEPDPGSRGRIDRLMRSKSTTAGFARDVWFFGAGVEDHRLASSVRYMSGRSAVASKLKVAVRRWAPMAGSSSRVGGYGIG